jgi:hypothetical protein
MTVQEVLMENFSNKTSLSRDYKGSPKRGRLLGFSRPIQSMMRKNYGDSTNDRDSGAKNLAQIAISSIFTTIFLHRCFDRFVKKWSDFRGS